MKKTPIQARIEEVVSNGLGYRTSKKGERLNNESELQYHLGFLNLMTEAMEKGYVYIGDEPETREFFDNYSRPHRAYEEKVRSYDSSLSNKNQRELCWNPKAKTKKFETK